MSHIDVCLIRDQKRNGFSGHPVKYSQLLHFSYLDQNMFKQSDVELEIFFDLFRRKP